MVLLLYDCTALVLDSRMRMVTKVTMGRRHKMRTMPRSVRVASVHCCSHIMMLPATLSSILISALDTGASSPPRCVWRGNYKYINCRRNIQWSASKQRGTTSGDSITAVLDGYMTLNCVVLMGHRGQ
jgi:hypothetical protein